MQRIGVGTGNLSLSRIVFGSMERRGQTEAARARIVEAAIGAGITSIDTAPLYDFGLVEEQLGRVLAARRNDVEILSKVGLRWDDSHGEVLFTSEPPEGPRRVVRRDSRPQAIRRDVEESLSRLRTDHLDLVQIHHRDRDVPLEDSLGALVDLRGEGKLREIGVSNFEAEDLETAARFLGEAPGAPRLATHQLEYSLVSRAADAALIPVARSMGIGLLAYSPLAVGALSDRLLDPKALSDDLVERGPFFRPVNARLLGGALREVVVPISARLGAALAEVALAWILHRPAFASVIVGASNASQVESHARAADLALSHDEVGRLTEHFAALPLDLSAGLPWSIRTRKLVGRARRKLGRIVRRR